MTKETRIQKLIEHMESISPEQLIEEITNIQPTKNDRDIIAKIRQEGVEAPVINVLLYYMLLIDKRISWAYIQKLAAFFVRKEITTAGQALHYLQTNHKAKKQEKDKKEQTLRQLILQAMEKGYNDEQLGHYVRSLLTK